LQANESRRAKRDAFHRRDDVVVKYFYTTPYDAVWVSMIAACAGFFCYQCAKFACKICIQRLAFALPLNLCVPVIVFVLNAMCLHRLQDSCYFTNVLPYELFWKCPSIASVHDLITRPQTWFWLLWLLAQIWVTIHIWMPKCERLADTDRSVLCK